MTLTQPKTKLLLDGPCVCCDEPAEQTFTYEKKYPLRVWAASTNRKTGQRTLTKDDKKDKEGKNEMGLFEFDLPYCAKHLAQTKKLHKLHDKQNNAVAWLSAAAVVLFLVFGGFTWAAGAETNIQFGTRFCVVPIIIFVGAFGLLKFGLDSWNESRARQPEFADFPLDSQSGGGSGVGIEITEEETKGTKTLGTDVPNFLQLNFKSVEAANRFKQKYPGSRVIKGQDKLE
jgi:hypothetical protein